MAVRKEFRFEPSKDGLYLDVIHFGFTTPSYSIDIKKQRCTCKGFSIRETCRHIDRYLDTLKTISENMG